ncbi:hypothetical protein B0H14DRAFT_2574887 [Mycena olivaceomarginata]|nr:hypothetical protein B0H14DRAFT_2574887 [Mycena olivaceomarginata]
MRVPTKARGAHCLRVVRALPARGSVIAADVAGAGDGKLARGVLRIDGGSAESSASGAVWHGGWTWEAGRVWGDGGTAAARPRLVAETGVGAEEAGAGRGEATKAAWTTGTLVALAARSGDAARRTSGAGQALCLSGGSCCALRGDAPSVCGSGRVLFGREALGARGRDKSGTGDGERPLRALRAQDVVKVVPGSTAGAGVGRRRQYTTEEPRCAGRRRGDVGCEERHHRAAGGAGRSWTVPPGSEQHSWLLRTSYATLQRGGNRQRGEGVGAVRRGPTLHEISVKKLPTHLIYTPPAAFSAVQDEGLLPGK